MLTSQTLRHARPLLLACNALFSRGTFPNNNNVYVTALVMIIFKSNQ